MIYTVTNQKGGTGKSTTAAIIAAGATARGRKVLAIDVDPQGHLTLIMGGTTGAGSYEIITGQRKAADVVQHTEQGDLIAASDRLAAADSTLKGRSRIYGLVDALRAVSGLYDVIVIDTPPTLGTPLINGLTAADSVIIPMQADLLSMSGFNKLTNTIAEIRAHYNSRLNVAGILLTRYNPRTVLSREITATIKQQAEAQGIPVFKSTIRDSVTVKESQVYKESIFTYSPRSKVTTDYMAFLDELGI